VNTRMINFNNLLSSTSTSYILEISSFCCAKNKVWRDCRDEALCASPLLFVDSISNLSLSRSLSRGSFTFALVSFSRPLAIILPHTFIICRLPQERKILIASRLTIYDTMME
jgi:hypothetical protein